MEITIDISAQRIADLMVTAIEGDITYWCSAVLLKSVHQLQYSPWYSNPTLYDATDFIIEVHEIDDESAGAPPKVRAIDKNAFKLGLERFACSRHFGDFQAENEDATTGDVFLQFVALGEIVYG